jgi:uncharacterized delta-60 repeat protein
MRTKLLGALVVSLLVFGACSDDDDNEGAAKTDTSEAGGKTTDAAPTGLDTAFGQNGVLAAPLSTTDHDRLLAITNGPGGSFYAAGWTSPAGDNAMVLAKIGPDGKYDPAFGEAGLATVNVAVGGKTIEVARAVAVQPDGKILIAGPVEKNVKATGTAAKDTDIAVLRFDAAGKPDATFGKGGRALVDIGTGKPIDAETYVADNSWGVAALPDGRIVFFGSTPSADREDADYAIVGLTSTGALDPNFGTKGKTIVDLDKTGDSPRNMVVQPDGKLVFTGYSKNAEDVVSPVLIRTTSDGKLDTAFGTNGVANHLVLPGGVAESYTVGLQGDKYVMAGYGHGADPAEKVDLVSYRFNADGSWDKTYGTDGLTRIDVAKDADRGRNLAVLPDGRILAVGSGSPSAGLVDAMVVLLDKDGKSIPAFGTAGHALSDLGGPGDGWFGVAVAPDGKSVMMVGFKGADPKATDGTKDDSVMARIKL